MSYLPQLLTLGGVMLLACISPGPDFLAVSSLALGSRRAGLGAALGVACGCVLWATLAVFGLGVVLMRIGWVYSLVRLAGAAYLVWLGARMLLSAAHPASPALAAPAAPAQEERRSAFRRGLLVNASNPKAAVFFGSLFVTILPVGAPGWVQCATVAVVAAVSALWFTTLALMFSAGRVRACYGRIRRPVDALTGAALVGLGARLALVR